MKAKVTELENKGKFLVDACSEHDCTTTLSELKEMWEDEKIKAECKEMFNESGVFHILSGYKALKNSPRKFTIEQVQQAIRMSGSGIYMSEDDILTTLTQLPPQGLEVEIENNKIVKVYV